MPSDLHTSSPHKLHFRSRRTTLSSKERSKHYIFEIYSLKKSQISDWRLILWWRVTFATKMMSTPTTKGEIGVAATSRPDNKVILLLGRHKKDCCIHYQKWTGHVVFQRGTEEEENSQHIHFISSSSSLNFETSVQSWALGQPDALTRKALKIRGCKDPSERSLAPLLFLRLHKSVIK